MTTGCSALSPRLTAGHGDRDAGADDVIGIELVALAIMVSRRLVTSLDMADLPVLNSVLFDDALGVTRHGQFLHFNR